MGTLVNWLLFLETWQYFGTSQNWIEDQKNETEGVSFYDNFLSLLLPQHNLIK